MMKVKTFRIRINSEYTAQDEEAINDFFERVTFKKSSASFVESDDSKSSAFWSLMVHYTDTIPDVSTNPSQNTHSYPQTTSSQSSKPSKEVVEFDDLNDEELERLKYLKQWRFDLAELRGVPVFMILSNANLYSIARANPKNTAEIEILHGFGRKKTAKYGDDILALLNSF